MVKRILAFATAAVIAGTTVLASAPSEFRITINGLRNDSGSVRVGLYRSPEGFATKAGIFKSVVTRARAGSIEVTFEGIPAGVYGVAAFHDENDNDRFDQSFLGIPEEGFGFGNDAPVRLSAPSFSEASVRIDDSAVRETVTMRYW